MCLRHGEPTLGLFSCCGDDNNSKIIGRHPTTLTCNLLLNAQSTVLLHPDYNPSPTIDCMWTLCLPQLSRRLPKLRLRFPRLTKLRQPKLRQPKLRQPKLRLPKHRPLCPPQHRHLLLRLPRPNRRQLRLPQRSPQLRCRLLHLDIHSPRILSSRLQSRSILALNKDAQMTQIAQPVPTMAAQ